MTTVAMKNLWNYIAGLNLSARNRKWLSERLVSTPPVAKTKKKDPTLMTKEEFFAKIERAEKQIENGEYSEMLPGEDLTAHLKRLGYDL